MEIDEVKAMVCERYKVDFEDVYSPTLRHKITMPRHIIQYLLNVTMDLSLKRCSMVVGRKDHTSTIPARTKVEECMFCDPKTRNNVNYFIDKINEGLKK